MNQAAEPDSAATGSKEQFTEADLIAADLAYERWKDGAGARNEQQALELQIRANPGQWI